MVIEYILAGAFFILLGLVWILNPQFVFRIRNWPGVSKEMGMKRGGEIMYQFFGTFQLLIGLSLIILAAVK